MPLRTSTVKAVREQLALIADGRRALTAEELHGLAEACDRMLQALHVAPRPGEPRETVGVWHNADAEPAVNAVVSLLTPHLAEIEARREMTNREAAAALRDALQKSG
jgi:hypothetical protein